MDFSRWMRVVDFTRISPRLCCFAQPLPFATTMLTCAFFLVAQTQRSYGQTCTTTLGIHVVDIATHAPIPGVSLHLDRQPIGRTKKDGYLYKKVPCHTTFTLWTSHPNYKTKLTPIPGTGKKTLSLEIELEDESGEIITIVRKAPRPDSMNATSQLSGEELLRTRGKSLAETLETLPGVTSLKSGSGAAKPSVRGFYGRRLPIRVAGISHRALGWGLDHAPEIDPFSADKLTVVRGPAAVRYGPGAIGGVVEVALPDFPENPGVDGEFHAVGFLPQGGGVAARIGHRPWQVPEFAWQGSLSFTKQSDLRAPDYPLDNTARQHFNLGLRTQYKKDKTLLELSYNIYSSQLGICFCLQVESRDDFLAQLERQRPIGWEAYQGDFSISRPYQKVRHHRFIAKSKRVSPIGTFKGEYGLQLHGREEFDVVRTASGPQLDFDLVTHDLEASFEHKTLHLSDHWHLQGAVGVTAMRAQHDFQGLPFIPSYRESQGGLYAWERLIGHDWEFELGFRYDLLYRFASLSNNQFSKLVIDTGIPSSICKRFKSDAQCTTHFHTPSGVVGAKRNLSEELALKVQLSMASRSPNVDEQYIAGRAPTYPVLSTGLPTLGKETTYASSITAQWTSSKVVGEVSAYANYMTNYIYSGPVLDSTGAPVFEQLINGTFPRFSTRSVDATYYGIDGAASLKPTTYLQLEGQLSLVRARNNTQHTFLPYVPPDSFQGTARYLWESEKNNHSGELAISGQFTTQQTRFDENFDFAPPPSSYFLLNADVSTTFPYSKGTSVRIGLHGKNLLNTRYREYTSLLRYFVDQPGIELLFRISFFHNNK